MTHSHRSLPRPSLAPVALAVLSGAFAVTNIAGVARAQTISSSTPAAAEPAPDQSTSGAPQPTQAQPTQAQPTQAQPTQAQPTEPPEAALPPEPPPPEPPVDVEDVGPSPGPFRQGAIRISLLIGSGESTTDTYFILGGGAGYYVLNGLELGVDYEAWLGGSPTLQRLSPEARYVLWLVPTIKPYVGFFYRHTFVSGYDGLNSLGGRLGLYYSPERSRLYVGGGAVYERYLGCSDSVLGGCDEIYPEFAVGASF